MFEDLCDLQRQAQHFMTVLQATRSSPAPALHGSHAALVGSHAALDGSHGVYVDHAEDESTAMQMAELIVEVHGYVNLSLSFDAVMTELPDLAQTSTNEVTFLYSMGEQTCGIF